MGCSDVRNSKNRNLCVIGKDSLRKLQCRVKKISNQHNNHFLEPSSVPNSCTKMKAEVLLKISMKLFTQIGLYPYKHSKIDTIRNIVSVSVLFSILSLTICELSLNYVSVESFGRADAIPVYFKMMVMVIFFILDKKRLSKLLTNLQSLHVNEYDDALQKRIQKVETFGIRCGQIYGGIIVFSTIIYFLNALIIHVIPLNIYMIWDLENPYCYYSIFIYQAFAEIVLITFGMGFDLLFIYLVTEVCHHFEAIKYDIYKLDLIEPREVFLRELYKVMNYHCKLLRIVDEMRHLLSNTMMLQYMCTTLSLCMGFYLMNINGIPPSMNDFVKYSSFIVSFAVEFFIYCFGGVTIEEQSLSVADVAFQTNWWAKSDREARRGLSLLIQRSQKPGQLTIGGMIEMNLSIFVSVLQTSFSFYTLMQNINMEDP